MATQMFTQGAQPAPTRQIFASNIIYPALYPLPVTTDIISAFHVPSSRYFYQSSDGRNVIPYIALPLAGVPADPDQMKRDVAAWLADPPGSTIYSYQTVDSVDPQVDLFNIIEGKRVVVPAARLDAYLRDLGTLLDEMRNLRAQERFGLVAGRRLMELMLKYPFNPAANFILASQIAAAPTSEMIQTYLDERGIVHFNARDIIGLQQADIFFYLTRFYGPPVDGDLTSKVTERTYLRQATNETTRDIARLIPANLATFQRLRAEFDLLFNELNRDPNAAIERVFATNARRRILQSPFEYLELLRRPNNLPPLTLNTIRQLNSVNRAQIVGLLQRYADNDIITLVGTSIQDQPTRGALINQAAELLTTTNVFLLTPLEADICRNAESVSTLNEFRDLSYAYLGKGSFTTGFDCYEIEELIQSFEGNRDQHGVIVFRDPLNYNNQFRVQDLVSFRNAIRSGRAGIPTDARLITRFDAYIQQAEIQGRSDYQQIQTLRVWANQNEANKTLMRNIWMQYFYMGMFMRQWKGPGNPYPLLEAATGREAREGTETESAILDNVYREGFTLQGYLGQLPQNIQDVFWNLRVYFLVQGTVQDKGTTIRRRWEEVLDRRTYCIRMASGPWSFSGAYYLKQILNENIAGFDLTQGLQYIY